MGSRTYRGIPADVRTAQRRRRLTDACLQVVGIPGSQHAGVRRICAAARLNPRYFYESFSDFDELLVSVFDEIFANSLAAIGAARATAPAQPLAQATAMITAFIEQLTADPRAVRLMFTAALGSDALIKRRLSARQHIVELLAAPLHQAAPNRAALDPRTQAHLIVGGLVEVLGASVDGRLRCPPDQLVPRLVHFLTTTDVSSSPTADINRT
jgi:AcrR family transcriptional regulator